MTSAAAQPIDSSGPGGHPPLTLEQTRIHIPGIHRTGTKRLPKLEDALDFWQFSGAAANVAMQMARPGVGHGVADSKVESGALMVHPWKRLRTTASYLAVAILGTPEEKLAFREAVNVAHRQVRSEPGAAVKYNAFDRDLQLWVAACLYIGFEDSYQLLNGKMNAEQAEAFYSTSSTLGTTLQVTEQMWPATRADFDVYWNRACREVTADAKIRAFIDDLLHLRMIHWYLRVVFGGLLRFLTAGYLPPYFRQQLGVEWSALDQRRFENLFLFVGFVNRFIPRFLRNAGTRSMMADVRRRLHKQRALI
ncbi:oxygenase MpaB family protein [Nocardia yamanashiensis]|uniref:oxygenase MpaB family protein n=1 Tax=Nocardia yamanashiensis TaxID=209247 RepID=UPI001E2DDF89|nr:oxygenase MpaB family protein [Nocardia yamanashiensis]UGT44798.1 oxygenase MpaB family protein [Nocardia yamanashiensis]